MSLLNEDNNLETKVNKSPIGIFDSGVGGLTVLKSISEYMPGEDIIYFGDTSRVPYGEKSKEEILKYAVQAINFLKSKGVKVILIACGTVTSYIADIKSIVGEEIPIFGIIDAASKGAANATRNGNIGVMCTPVSAKVGLYEKVILGINSGFKVYTLGCPVLAPLIEKGITDESYLQIDLAVKSYVSSLKKHNVDTIILGCTHYPIIKDIIKKYAGEDVILIEPGKELANILKKRFENTGLANSESHKADMHFFVSGNAQKFTKDIENILGMDYIFSVGQVDIESYLI